MSYAEKLVDVQNNGLFCLCFRNKDALSVEKIREIFAEYGTISSINCAGNEHGYRFVRYQVKEEALRCAIALENHPNIQLQPVKSNRNYQRAADGQSNETQQRYNHEKDNTYQMRESEGFMKHKTNGADTTPKFQGPNADDYTTNDSHSNNNLNASNSNQLQRDDVPQLNFNNDNSIEEPKNSCEFSISEVDGCNNRIDGRHPVAHFTKPSKLEELYKLRGTNANTFAPSANCQKIVPNETFVPAHTTANQAPNSIVCNSKTVADVSGMDVDALKADMDELVVAARNGQIGDNPCPSLIANESPRYVPQKYDSSISSSTNLVADIQVIRAESIIVANIHPNLGLDNVYKLFEKFDPIYVSDLELVPPINVKYCNVYFKTALDAFHAEQTFDGQYVCGESLIVLRSRRLQEEAGF